MKLNLFKYFASAAIFAPTKAEKSSLLKALVATIYKKKDYIWPDWMWWWGEARDTWL